MSRTTIQAACDRCGTHFEATREERPEQLSGRYDCPYCGDLVYEWAGFHDIFGWRAITTIEPRRPGFKL
jgi:DNA-directed RNA polymerase subunit RPC12/RpoP